MVGFWVCQDCNEIIPRDELKTIRHVERHYWLDDCPAEDFYEFRCPYCGSELIDEAEYCDGCGEPCSPKDLTDGLCAVCREEAEKEEKARAAVRRGA